MITLLPIPDWQGLHPLIVHFPIALLLIAPLFVLIGALRKPQNSGPYFIAALILMAIGTAATFISASTGEAASKLVTETPQVEAVLERHEDLAEIVEIAFGALTAIFATIVFAPRLLRRQPGRIVSTVLPSVFLVFYAAGAILLANTAHNGGLLVHQLGVTARISSSASTPVQTAERE